MRLWIKILIGALALALVLVAGAALFISQMDPNEYRGVVADLVEDATGRQLQVAGDLRIKLLPVLSVEANDVTFANAPWASQPDMVRAKRVRAEVALLPLLKGRMVVHQFVVLEPEVFLETDAQGRGNWEFSEEGVTAADSEVDTDAPSEGLEIIVTQIRIEKASLDYLNGKTSSKTVVRLDELTLGSEGPGGRLAVNLQATYQDLPVKLGGRLGAADAIVRNQPIEVDLEGSVGAAGFTVQGAVGKPLEGKNLRLDVAMKSRSTKKISDVIGADIEELGPLDVSLRIVEEGGYFHLDPVNVSARPRDTEASISGSVKSFAFDLASGSAGGAAPGTPMSVDLEGRFGDASFNITGDVGTPLDAKDSRLDVAFKTGYTKPLTELAGMDFEEVGPVNFSLTLLEKDGHYDFEDIKLTARPRDTEVKVSGSIKNFVLDLDGAKAKGKPAKVDVKGAIGEARFAVSGDVGSLMEGKDLRLKVAVKTKSTRPLTDLAGVDVEEVGPLDLRLILIEKDGRFDLDGIDVAARPRDADVVVKGSVRDIVSDPRPNLDISVSAKTLRRLDETLPDVGPVKVSAKVRSRGKVIEIRDLVARIGKSDLAGSATVDTGGKRPSASAKLRGSLIDLTELEPAAEKSDPGDATAKPAEGKVFPDSPLPFDVLEKANGNIEIAVDRLVTPKLTLNKVNVVAKLDNGNLTVKLVAHIAGGKVGGTIDIDSRAKPAKFTADFDAKKVSIGMLTKQIRGYETSKGLDSDLKMKLRGQGDSVRTLMGGLDGDIRLKIGEGRLNNDVLGRVGGDLFTQILGVAVPADEEDKVTILNCGVVRFAIENGDAVADETLVMETDKVLVKGGGLIDLKTEKLDIGANLTARKGIRIGAGTLSSLVRVQGTLAKPQLGTDLTGMAKTGTRIGIAIATGGLSLLAESVYGSLSEDEHPCQTALARPIEATPSEFRAQSTSKGN
jgi:uncharacterized protein involved in outer membrane biogenesis